MLRQGAGLTTLQGLFDSLDYAQKQLGRLRIKLIQANFDIEICKEAINMFGSGEIEKQNSNDPIALVIMKQRLRALTEKKEILERMIARNKIDAGLFIMFEIQISRIPKEVIPIWQNITTNYVGQLTLSNANELANTILDQTSDAFMNYSNQATANVDSVLKLSKRTILSENDLKKDTANLIETVRKIGQFSTDVATTLEMRQVSTDNFLEAFNTEVSSIEYK
jgi:DNA-binding transcriptional MerR regulator